MRGLTRSSMKRKHMFFGTDMSVMALAKPFACRCGTGILPVFHGRDAHATGGSTGILPVFKTMKAWVYLTLATFGLLAAGCGKQTGETQPEAAAEQGAATRPTDRVEKMVKDMRPEDVIVEVQGVAFKKRDLDQRLLAIKARLDRDMNMVPQQKAVFLRQAMLSSVPRFVDTQLLVADAKQKGVLDPSGIDATVSGKIDELVKKSKKPVATVYAQHPGGEMQLRRDIADGLWVEALIASNIPPKTVVDDAFIASVRVAIKADNDATTVTNNMKIAQLREIRRAAMAGEVDFGEQADKISECELSAPGKKGYWGEFSRRDFDSVKLRTAVFALKAGEICDVHEDDEGYQIVRVDKRIAEQRNAQGVVIEPEAVVCSRIYLAKLPLLEIEADESLKKNLQAQMRQQAISEYVEQLRTNGVYTVTYPHGTNFFGSAQTGRPDVANAHN